jgi:hypothetical protein
VLIAIGDGSVLGGDLPHSTARPIEQWRTERQAEPVANWELAQVPAALRAIEPLR